MMAANPPPLQALPYEDQHHLRPPRRHMRTDDDDDVGDGEFDDGGGAAAADAMDEAEDVLVTSYASPDYLNYHQHHRPGGGGGGIVVASRTSELTLAFEGEMYVFPAVTPDKVQAVLLLLGGREIASSVPLMDVPLDSNGKAVDDNPKLSNLSRRIASLIRFREKRKERCFDKKIRYSVRKEVAQRMHRKNGQFVSLKESSGSSSWVSGKNGLQADGSPCQETVCQHCGVSENSTPAMRRGPAGPRTLCNACGLMWANKGTLRDLSKGGRNHSLDHMESETPIDVKPLLLEGKHFSGNHEDPGTAEDTSKAVNEGNNSPVNQDDKDLCETTEDVTNSLPVGIISSSGDLDEQEALVEFANACETEMDIPTNFD